MNTNENNPPQVDATLEGKLVDAVKCDYCTPAGYMLHHPHCPHSFENENRWREGVFNLFALNVWQDMKEKVLCGESFKEKLRPHFTIICDTISAHARKSQPGVNERLVKAAKAISADAAEFEAQGGKLTERCAPFIRELNDAIRAAESAAPGENLEVESKAQNLVRAFRILVKPLADRWAETSAWHACNNNGVAFRDGEIHIRTGLLQDFYALTYGDAPESLEAELAEALREVVAHAPPDDDISDKQGARWVGDGTLLRCQSVLAKFDARKTEGAKPTDTQPLYNYDERP